MTTDPITASIKVAAPPEHVFERFTSSTVSVRGAVAVDIDGVAARGHYLELDPPRRLLISWGHVSSAHCHLASTVEILLTAELAARG